MHVPSQMQLLNFCSKKLSLKMDSAVSSTPKIALQTSDSKTTSNLLGEREVRAKNKKTYRHCAIPRLLSSVLINRR